MKTTLSNRTHNNRGLVAYCLPALILVTVFVYVPLINGFSFSMLNWDGLSQHPKFVGAKNFIRLLTDDHFLGSVGYSLLYTAANLIFVNIAALLLAGILTKEVRMGGIARTLFFAPNVISLVVVGMIWLFIFSTVFSGLSNMTGMTWINIDWFASEWSARLALFIVTSWVTTGYLMIIYIAGFNAIDCQLLEAARIDGSSGLNLFFKIKLPLIMPSVVICVFWITLYSLKIFDIPFTVTNGGPFSSTETMPVNIYYTAFTYAQYGYASAKSIVLFAIIMVITLFEVAYLKRKELEG